MDRNELLRQITDFWREQGAFGAARCYVGMDAGQKSELFFKCFDALNEDDKREAMRLLKEIESGERSKLRRWRDEAHSLLVDFAVRHKHRHWLTVLQRDLETEFNDRVRLEEWSRAHDRPADGRSYDKGYDAAVLRYIVLRALGSRRVQEAWQYLVEHAVAQRFRQLLWINQQLGPDDFSGDHIIEIDYSDPDHPIVLKHPLTS